jgi:hypothetical protein
MSGLECERQALRAVLFAILGDLNVKMQQYQVEAATNVPSRLSRSNQDAGLLPAGCGMNQQIASVRK